MSITMTNRTVVNDDMAIVADIDHHILHNTSLWTMTEMLPRHEPYASKHSLRSLTRRGEISVDKIV